MADKRSNLDLIVERVKRRVEALKNAASKKQSSFSDIQKLASEHKLPNKQGGGVLPQITNSMRSVRGRVIPPKIAPITPPKTTPLKTGIPPTKPGALPESFKREPYIIPSDTLLSTPEWFKISSNKIDVSIIVPMYRSRNEIVKQIESWDTSDDGLVKEIIYVSDSCPQASEEEIVKEWSKKQQPVGKIVLLSNNAGYATACNMGAKHAQGKYLVFLNADTTVTANWVKPMCDLMQKDSTIGIVGNLQLKDNGLIDSAGSEWMWDNKSFEHIGRNVYKGKRLHEVMDYVMAPDDLKHASERDMVTGCCIMISKKLFDEIGGFDVKYRIGYWEDSDLCMQVKSRGYKVYYEPASRIYHKSGHSRASLHPFAMDNVKRFYSLWVDNKKIDVLVKNKRP